MIFFLFHTSSQFVYVIFGLYLFASPILFLWRLFADIANNSDYKKKLTQYYNDLERYKKTCAEQDRKYQRAQTDYQTVLRNGAQQLAVLNVEIPKLTRALNDSKSLLSIIYGTNIIAPKYRSLAHTALLYEYFVNKRCDSLEGRDGAYNLLELEEHLHQIVLQLDAVLKSLDKIQRNQRVLYDTISEGNEISRRLCRSTDSLREQVSTLNATGSILESEIKKMNATSAITAYNAEQTKKQLEYMNHMSYYSGKYDKAGIYKSSPPV